MISPASRTLQRRALDAHGVLGSGRPEAPPAALSGLRPVVRDSWLRSLGFLPDPGHAVPQQGLGAGELEAYRAAHPLAVALPVLERLLVDPARDTGLITAVGDAAGRLLWVEGDAAARRRAATMAFEPGADWSERAVGTSAPGTALATGMGVQISGAEHFSPNAHCWSCSAVPLRDPATGDVIGVVDLTGGPEAVSTHSLSFVQAAVAAAEAEIRLQRLAAGPARTSPVQRAPRRTEPGSGVVRLSVLGHDGGTLAAAGRDLALGNRHAEILALLAWNPAGLGADELALRLYGDPGQAATLRPEMVRLRRVLAAAGFAELGPLSRPYRLGSPVDLDARAVLDLVGRGRHRRALEAYAGPVLPRSVAPGIEELRAEVGSGLRQAMLQDAGAEALMGYLALPEAADDEDALRTALRILPARSPRRSVLVARLERLEAESA